MTSLTLTVEELQQLNALIGNVPTKFGLPIVQFFSLVQQKRKLKEKKLLKPLPNTENLQQLPKVESKSNGEKLPYLKVTDDDYNGKQVQENENVDRETGTDQENHPF